MLKNFLTHEQVLCRVIITKVCVGVNGIAVAGLVTLYFNIYTCDLYILHLLFSKFCILSDVLENLVF